MQTLRRTPLYDRHVAAGARLVPFAGWEMPVQYEGVIPEHRAVRTDAGVFDVSHMGEIEVEGPTARDLLQSAALERHRQAGARRGAVHAADDRGGGIIDDLIAYRLDEHRYLLDRQRVESRAVYRWLKERELRGSDVRDVSDDYALLAVQGPRSLERLGLPPGRRSLRRWASWTAIEVMVNRTGYTGEEGVELACMEEDAPALWDAVLARGVVPCGLGARDTLRLEVCYPLHGNDIGPQWDAISVGPRLGVCARHGVHRRRAAARGEGARAGAQARPVPHDREGDPAAGHADRGRRRGHLGLALADARRRHRARRTSPPRRRRRVPSS